MFCCGWGGNQFTPLLLLYRREGGYSNVVVDLFLGTYVVGLIPGLLVAGALSDRHGRKPLMVVGTVLSCCSSVLLMFGEASARHRSMQVAWSRESRSASRWPSAPAGSRSFQILTQAPEHAAQHSD